MTGLRIYLFDTVRVVRAERHQEINLTLKTQALLAFLLLNGERLHPREQVASVFWPDHSPKQARSSLSTTLWRLRRRLEPKRSLKGRYLITTANDEIGFNWRSQFWLDVNRFEEQARTILNAPVYGLQDNQIQSLEDRLKLYTGHLLNGHYDEWIISKREWFRGLYLTCLEKLMAYYHQQGGYEQSLSYGQRILQVEPTNEAVHREMMRLYFESGQRALAIQQYEVCCDILARELDISPLEETHALYHQIVGRQDLPATIPVDRTDLQDALTQYKLAINAFEKAQHQLTAAQGQFEQAHQRFRQSANLVEQLMRPQ